MTTLKALTIYLDNLLQPELYKDYCVNGLQVGGKEEIRTLVTGVTASQALIDAAVSLKADALLVHHGFFWKNESPSLVGMKYRRLRSLFLNEISLLAYHLPLDAHIDFGNNVQLGKLLGLEVTEMFYTEPNLKLGFLSHLKQPMEGEGFSALLSEKLSRTPLYIKGSEKPITKIAWCTGGAQDYIQQAIENGADAYMTGEVSERTVHIARENEIHFYAAGHHATERYGVKALGEHLSREFQIDHHFIDIDNPV